MNIKLKCAAKNCGVPIMPRLEKMIDTGEGPRAQDLRIDEPCPVCGGKEFKIKAVK